jgi:hypothetical protein
MAPDDRDPALTRAFGVWADAAVPALPDDFTARVVAEAAVQRAGAAWAEAAVPALPDDFTARLMADVAAQQRGAAWADAVPTLPEGFAATVAQKALARPKLQVLAGGTATPAVTATAPARRWWQWPAVAVAAAAVVALVASRAQPTADQPEPVAQRAEAGVTAPAPTAVERVAVAMAEVTRVEVLGAERVAVLSMQGEGGGSGSPVVWITDKAEDAPAGDLETRMQ